MVQYYKEIVLDAIGIVNESLNCCISVDGLSSCLEKEVNSRKRMVCHRPDLKLNYMSHNEFLRNKVDAKNL